ncbi:cation diffusion facilitator family transporter [soil metagenome]
MADSLANTPESYSGGQHHGHRHDVRRLRLALLLTASLFGAEVVGGILSNSLALLADAGHMLTDVGALSLSLFVAWFSRQAHTPSKTYGYLRWEILAALLNGTVLLLISGWIVWESIARFRTPQPVSGGLMLIVALAGLAVNVAAALILHPSSKGSLNIRGAYLHVLSDLLASVGTVGAALIIQISGWLYADPLASVFTTLLIVRAAWRLVRESVDVLLEAAPSHISPGAVRAQLAAIPGIESVHDLHVWTVSSGMVAMSAHAIVREAERHQHVLEHIHDAMRLFGIHHVTVQLERSDMYDHEVHLHE